MPDSCPIVLIASDATPGGYIVINETDFDGATMTIFDAPLVPPPPFDALPPAVEAEVESAIG